MTRPPLVDASATIDSGTMEAGSDDEFLSPVRAAAWLTVSLKSLERWRHSGGGPPLVRFSHKTIRYRIGDLEAFVISRVRTSTAQD